MAYQRFSLFPDSPSFKDLFSARSLRYRWRNGDPVITTAIMAICIVVWAIEAVLFLVWPEGGNAFVNAGMLLPATAVRHPWTFITSMFLHQPTSLWHILFNMLTLWCVGPVLERMMGHWPYLALYLLSGLGGGAGLMVWAVCSPSGWMTAAYGASGALFGLFAAILVVYRRIGIDIRSMLIWMLINFLMPVITPGIAWQAHVGGFIVGGVLAWLLVTGLHAFPRQKPGVAHHGVRHHGVRGGRGDHRGMQRRQSADAYVTSVPVMRELHTCSFPHPWITLWISEVRPVGKSGITWWIIHKDIHKMAEHKEFPM